MRKKILKGMVIFLVFLIGLTPSSWAGQVVTEELSLWAKQAIEQEKTISTIAAPNTIAVLYFQNKTGKPTLDPLQKGLSLMLMTDLAKVKEIQVVERVKLQALVEELNLGVSGLVDSKTAPRVGRFLAARFLGGGEILKGLSTELQIDPNLLDVSDSMLFRQANVHGDLTELISIEKELLFDIIRLMDIKLTPEQKADLEKPLSASVAALLLLFKGIEAGDGGNYKMAADFYQKALKKDPNLNMAKDAFREVQELNLKTKKAEKTPKETAEKTPPEKAETAPTDIAKPPPKGGGGLGTVIVLGLVLGAAGAAYATGAFDNIIDPTPTPTPTPTPPKVLSTSPANGATDVDAFLTEISIQFDKAMDTTPGDIAEFVESSNSTLWNISDSTLEWQTSSNCTIILDDTVDPYSRSKKTITFVLNPSGPGFKDTGGNALERYTFSFTFMGYPD